MCLKGSRVYVVGAQEIEELAEQLRGAKENMIADAQTYHRQCASGVAKYKDECSVKTKQIAGMPVASGSWLPEKAEWCHSHIQLQDPRGGGVCRNSVLRLRNCVAARHGTVPRVS